MTQTELMQTLWKRYQKEHGYESSRTREVVEWAVTEGLLPIPKVDPIDILSNQMAKALREETAVDEEGREYRVNHAVKITKNGTQTTIWGILGHMPDNQTEMSFTQRREQIIGDCLHLRNDVDAYNNIQKGNKLYQLELNFTEDVEERLALLHIKIA